MQLPERLSVYWVPPPFWDRYVEEPMRTSLIEQRTPAVADYDSDVETNDVGLEGLEDVSLLFGDAEGTTSPKEEPVWVRVQKIAEESPALLAYLTKHLAVTPQMEDQQDEVDAAVKAMRIKLIEMYRDKKLAPEALLTTLLLTTDLLHGFQQVAQQALEQLANDYERNDVDEGRMTDISDFVNQHRSWIDANLQPNYTLTLRFPVRARKAQLRKEIPFSKLLLAASSNSVHQLLGVSKGLNKEQEVVEPAVLESVMNYFKTGQCKWLKPISMESVQGLMTRLDPGQDRALYDLCETTLRPGSPRPFFHLSGTSNV